MFLLLDHLLAIVLDELVEHRVLHLTPIELSHPLEALDGLIVSLLREQPLSALADQQRIAEHAEGGQGGHPQVVAPVANPDGQPGRGHQSEAVKEGEYDVKAKGATFRAEVLEH